MKKLFYIVGLLLLAATGYYLGFESKLFGSRYFLLGLKNDIKLDILIISFLTLICIMIFNALKEGSGKALLLFMIIAISGASPPGGFENNLPRLFNIKLFGAKADINRIVNAAMSATSTTLTSATANFTSADAGKAIRVWRAGTSGHDLVTTIASVSNSTTIILSAPSVGAVSSDTAVYGSDNTAAIQAALNADSANNGGKVWIPNGAFGVSSALNTTYGGVNPNCQIHLPLAYFTNSSLNNRMHFVIEGETPPNYAPSLFADSLVPLNGSIIYSLIDGSGNLPAVFGTKSADVTVSPGINYNYVTFRNLTILVPQNAANGGTSIGGINMFYSPALVCENVLVNADGPVASSVQPTNEVAGIVMNSAGTEIQGRLTGTQVGQFKYGIIAADDAYLEDPCIFLCQYGLVLAKNIENVQANYLRLYWNNNGIYVPNATIGGYVLSNTVYFHISNLVSEVFSGSGKWYDYSFVVNDVGNKGIGDINYTIIQAAGTFANNFFNMTGGTGIKTRAIGSGGIPATLDATLAAGNTSNLTPILSNHLYTGTGYAFQSGSIGIQSLSATNSVISNNGHYDGVSAFRYDTTGAVAWLQPNAGTLLGRVAVSGSTGASITPINAFSFNSDLSGGIGGNGTVDGSTNYWLNWTTAGMFSPKATVTQDMGTASLAWRDVYLSHTVGESTIGVSSSLGTNVTSVTPAGNDEDFSLTVVTSGNTTGTTGLIAFGRTWGATPKCVISSANAATGAMIASAGGYVALAATSASSMTLAGVFTGAGTWVFNCHCGQ